MNHLLYLAAQATQEEITHPGARRGLRDGGFDTINTGDERPLKEWGALAEPCADK